MKIGLDMHGVLDDAAAFFALITPLLIAAGHEVHIITGSEDRPELREKLQSLGIQYTHLFSIVSYHKSIGTEVWYKGKNDPWMDKDVWDKTKALYCAREGIDIHLDDSAEYGKHFVTPFFLFKNAGPERMPL